MLRLLSVLLLASEGWAAYYDEARTYEDVGVPWPWEATDSRSVQHTLLPKQPSMERPVIARRPSANVLPAADEAGARIAVNGTDGEEDDMILLAPRTHPDAPSDATSDARSDAAALTECAAIIIVLFTSICLCIGVIMCCKRRRAKGRLTLRPAYGG